MNTWLLTIVLLLSFVVGVGVAIGGIVLLLKNLDKMMFH